MYNIINMVKIILTNHAIERLLDRNVNITQVKKVIKKPLEILSKENNIMKVVGVLEDKRILKVIYKKIKGKIIIITAYYEN